MFFFFAVCLEFNVHNARCRAANQRDSLLKNVINGLVSQVFFSLFSWQSNKSPGTLPVLFWNLFYLLICSCPTCLSSYTRSQCSCLALEPPSPVLLCSRLVLDFLCLTMFLPSLAAQVWMSPAFWIFLCFHVSWIWIPLLDRYTSHLKSRQCVGGDATDHRVSTRPHGRFYHNKTPFCESARCYSTFSCFTASAILIWGMKSAAAESL